MLTPVIPNPGDFARDSKYLFIHIPHQGWFVYKPDDRGRWTWFWDTHTYELCSEIQQVFGMRKSAARAFMRELAGSELGCRDVNLANYVQQEARRCR
jgi:hypothetical protein